MARQKQLESFNSGGRTFYLHNKDLLEAIHESRKMGEMSDTLARLLQLLCKRYATHPWFSGYTWIEDMQAEAMLLLVRTWKGFDPERGSNPFAYYTQTIKRSYYQYRNNEKKRRSGMDRWLIEQGYDPSSSYEEQESGPRLQFSESDEQDIEQMQREYKDLQRTANNVHHNAQINDFLSDDGSDDQPTDKLEETSNSIENTSN